MKYLKKFNNHAAYTAALSTLELPNVSIDGEHVHYNPVLPPKKKYIVALSMVEDYYVSPIVDANSQSINSNIERVYYCDLNALMALVSNPAGIFNIDPVELEFDYIEGEDLKSPSYSGQQFPAATAFFYELKDDTYIEDYMFYHLTFLVFVPDTVTSIGEYAFYTDGTNQVFMESETPPEKQENSFNFGSKRMLLVFTDAAEEAYSLAWDLNPEYIVVLTAKPNDPIDDGLI